MGVRVIDFHLHVGTKSHWTPWVMDFFRQVNPFYYDHFSEQITPDGVLAFLKGQGVHKAVVLSEYAPETSGVVTNEFTSWFCSGQEDLIPFGSICLYSEEPPEEQAERAIKQLSIKGFKMLPTYAHFYPNDPKLFPFYEVAQQHRTPLAFHTGISFFRGSKVKYGDPLLLDDVACDFPSLPIVLEHGGRSFWYDRAGWLIGRHPNMYIGLAGIPAKQLLQHFPHLERHRDRFIFGSDWPGVPDIRLLAEKIYSLPIEQETRERILWKNAAELLGLS